MLFPQILLDGSGILKFGNFCISKAEGETLEDFFTLLSTTEEAGEGNNKENFDNMRKRLQGDFYFSLQCVCSIYIALLIDGQGNRWINHEESIHVLCVGTQLIYAEGISLAAGEHVNQQAGLSADMLIISETCYALWGNCAVY